MMLRRHIWRWLAAATLITFIWTAAIPAAASADPLFAAPCGGTVPLPVECVTYPTAGLQTKDWTYLNLNYCPPGMACAAIFRESMGAWRRHTSAPTCTPQELARDRGCWRQATLRGGWVYVSPYTGSWRWAWTRASGWVAVTGGRFELRPY